MKANDMVSSVFRNVLKNAVQHNDKDITEIEVTVRETEGEVVVEIADNGPGIPESHREEIFHKTKTGERSEGTGIGLYLVETLVDDYDGEVWIEDNDPEGTIFKIKLLKTA
ncbi:MAG: sensor histidine kinase [Halobacteria archaeon]